MGKGIKTLFEKDESQDIYFYIVGWIFVAAFAFFWLLVGVGRLHVASLIPKCTFHTVTGYYCPGCGATRAVLAFVHGHPLISLFYHPFITFIAVLGGWFMVSQTIERLSGHRLRVALHYRGIYLVLTLVLIFGNWIFKDAFLLLTGIPLIG